MNAINVYLSIFFTVGSLFSLSAMDKPLPKNAPIAAKMAEFVDLETQSINYNVGRHIRFYGEYKVKPLPNNAVSFPLEAADPLIVYEFGSIPYFFTSAATGKMFKFGEAIKIEDPHIFDVVAIRGTDDVSGNRFEAYIGINKKNFKIKNNKKIYPGQLLALSVKSKQDINNAPTTLYGTTKYLTNADIGREVVKNLQNPGDNNWNNERFWKVILTLLGGEGWKESIDVHNRRTYTKDDITVSANGLYSRMVYWDQHQNLLKGIAYKNKP